MERLQSIIDRLPDGEYKSLAEQQLKMNEVETRPFGIEVNTVATEAQVRRGSVSEVRAFLPDKQVATFDHLTGRFEQILTGSGILGSTSEDNSDNSGSTSPSDKSERIDTKNGYDILLSLEAGRTAVSENIAQELYRIGGLSSASPEALADFNEYLTHGRFLLGAMNMYEIQGISIHEFQKKPHAKDHEKMTAMQQFLIHSFAMDIFADTDQLPIQLKPEFTQLAEKYPCIAASGMMLLQDAVRTFMTLDANQLRAYGQSIRTKSPIDDANRANASKAYDIATTMQRMRTDIQRGIAQPGTRNVIECMRAGQQYLSENSPAETAFIVFIAPLSLDIAEIYDIAITHASDPVYGNFYRNYARTVEQYFIDFPFSHLSSRQDLLELCNLNRNDAGYEMPESPYVSDEDISREFKRIAQLVTTGVKHIDRDTVAPEWDYLTKPHSITLEVDASSKYPLNMRWIYIDDDTQEEHHLYMLYNKKEQKVLWTGVADREDPVINGIYHFMKHTFYRALSNIEQQPADDSNEKTSVHSQQGKKPVRHYKDEIYALRRSSGAQSMPLTDTQITSHAELLRYRGNKFTIDMPDTIDKLISPFHPKAQEVILQALEEFNNRKAGDLRGLKKIKQHGHPGCMAFRINVPGLRKGVRVLLDMDGDTLHITDILGRDSAY